MTSNTALKDLGIPLCQRMGVAATVNDPDSAYVDGQDLWQISKVILVMDLVDADSLMAADESGVVSLWHGFLKEANKLISRRSGRVVNSVREGLLAEFDRAHDAISVAAALHKMIQPANHGRAVDSRLHLQIGVNAVMVHLVERDLGSEVYDTGVNMAARLALLAGPGETVVSSSVRDQLSDGLDAEVEDLGECYLKHIGQPVRAFRIGPAGPRPVPVLVQVPESESESEFNLPLQPTIAVIPFTSRSAEPELFAIGELIADGVIHQLGKAGALRVISRMSTTVLRGREDAELRAHSHLGAPYVLSGSYWVLGEQVTVVATLTDTASQSLIWTDRIQADMADLFRVESEIGHAISSAASFTLIAREVDSATLNPIPTLRSYNSLLGAVTLMHRSTRAESLRARGILDRLAALHHGHDQPLAWLGKWFVLQVAQGWSHDPVRDANEALGYCQRALECDSQSALAVAVTGQVHGYLKHDLATAQAMYHQALDLNPNESLAWLWLGMTYAFRGEGEIAIRAAERALSLSPLDPLLYYYQSLAASAAISAGQYDRAIMLANASLRANRTHTSTYRALAIAQVLSGRVPDARLTIKHLLRLEPHFTVRAFLARYPGRDVAAAYTHMLADALTIAGLPA